jgi:hypothetical protein
MSNRQVPPLVNFLNVILTIYIFVSGIFDGKPADYFFMLLFNWFTCIVIGLIAEIPVSTHVSLLQQFYMFKGRGLQI